MPCELLLLFLLGRKLHYTVNQTATVEAATMTMATRTMHCHCCPVPFHSPARPKLWLDRAAPLRLSGRRVAPRPTRTSRPHLPRLLRHGTPAQRLRLEHDIVIVLVMTMTMTLPLPCKPDNGDFPPAGHHRRLISSRLVALPCPCSSQPTSRLAKCNVVYTAVCLAVQYVTCSAVYDDL